MKDEIKEILDKLAKKSSIYKEQISRGTSFNTDEYEASLLLDYITNLQKQIEEYQKALDETMSEKIDLQEEIERQSKAQVILDDMLAEYKSKIDLQEEENQRLKENNQNMQVEMSRSWEIIDKAIKYKGE